MPSRRDFVKMGMAIGTLGPLASLHSTERRKPRQAAGSEIRRFPSSVGREVTLAFVGDVFLTERYPCVLHPNTKAVYNILKECDAVFANLENGLSTVGSPHLGGFKFGSAIRGSPSLVTELHRAGITAVSLANNHTGNYGRNALNETIDTLDEEGIDHAGAGNNITAASKAAYLELGGITIAFLSLYSYYYHYEADDLASQDRSGIAYLRAYDTCIQIPTGFETQQRNISPYILPVARGDSQSVMAPLKEDVKRMENGIRTASEQADFTIVSAHLHWGRHTKEDVPFQQRTLFQLAINAGADLVVAHGPHILRGIEEFKSALILYSLGNFIMRRSDSQTTFFAQDNTPSERKSAVLIARVGPGGITSIDIIPIVINLDGQPRIAPDLIGHGTISKLEGMSAQFATSFDTREWHGNVNR